MKSANKPTVLPIPIREAALRLNIPYSTLRSAVKRGSVPSEKLSSRYIVVYLEDVQAWLDSPQMHKRGLGSPRFTGTNPRKK